MSRSITLLTALLVVVSGTFALPAYADKPERIEDRFVDRSSCDFPVAVHVWGKVSVKTFTRDGVFYKAIATSPGLKVSFKNLRTKETVRYSIAGPGIIKIQGGQERVAEMGPWIWDFNPVTGEQGWWITRGRHVTVYDADGNIISSTFSGRLIDVCSKLAS